MPVCAYRAYGAHQVTADLESTGLTLKRTTAITIVIAASGTALFSMLIALSHAMQGKDASLSRTLLIAAPACVLLSLLGVPATAHARRTNPDHVGARRALLKNAA